VRYVKSYYLQPRFFLAMIICVICLVLGYVWPLFFATGKFFLLIILLGLFYETYLLYRGPKNGIVARRICASRFSNGDQNTVELYIENRHEHAVKVTVIEEMPVQLQRRDNRFTFSIKRKEQKVLRYQLRPVRRGAYHFGYINVFATTPLGLAARRYREDRLAEIKVYPSFAMLRHYELLAISNQLSQIGIKKIRKIGHNIEFDHIKEYVQGDDYRTINWKATARKGDLMVNIYQDEKSQNVYSLLDMGRVMQMPFEGMSLLDYAINAALVVSSIAIRREDRAGIMTFESVFGTYLPAEKRKKQLPLILDTLYNQQTQFGDSDFSRLFIQVKNRIRQRSLLLLYTNFESMYALERQLHYLKQLNKSHLLVVIFFQNTELQQLLESNPASTQEIYDKVVAEKFAFEKRQIIKKLQHHGIQSVLTKPADLTVDVINKYIELKARHLI